jgi:hypothetical protein
MSTPPADRRCTGTNKDGTPCGRWDETGERLCHTHVGPPPDERRCTGTASGGATLPERKGERCEKWAIAGGTVCESHGGKAPQVRSAADARIATQKVRALVETYGLPVEITPELAILGEVHRTAGHVAWLEQQVRALSPSELTWGVTRVKEGGDDRGTTEEAAPHVLLKLYHVERAHLVKVCSEALRAGIEERRVKLAEHQGALVADVIRAILGDLKLNAKQQARVREVVPRHLRALATG